MYLSGWKIFTFKETVYDAVNSGKKRLFSYYNHKHSRFWSHNQTKQIVAEASNPSRDINEMLSFTDHSESSTTQKTSQDSKSNRHINALNIKHQNSSDSKHHDVPIAERSAYLKSKLKLDQNPLLEEGDRKQKLLKILLQHWDVFDYYNERIPSARTDVKHYIEPGNTPPYQI